MPEREPWSWKRFFGGFVEGGRYGKDLAILSRQLVMIGLIVLIVFGVIWTKERLFGKSTQPSPDVITAETANVDKSQKVVNQTYYPFAGGLFSWLTGKTQDLSNNDTKPD